MAREVAEIECFESQDDSYIVHEPNGATVRFPTFDEAKRYCHDHEWEIFVVESPWDEEFAEWQ